MLNKGDKIGLVTPSGFISEEKLNRTIRNLKKFGLIPFYTDKLKSKRGYLAGTDKERLQELHEMFSDKNIKAILCVRGGYGATRLLDQIDYKLIKNNPKPFVGFSDITALLSAFYKYANLPSFHGIVGASLFSDYTQKCFRDILMNSEIKIEIKSFKDEQEDQYILKSGAAEGIMIGGNLAVITSLLGTPFDIDWTDKIIFLEEINEPPYKIDRMLTQLISAGKFNNVKAVIFGKFNKCDKNDFRIKEDESFSLKEVITERFQKINVPSVYGFSFGHVKNQAIFPFGMNVIFEADKFQIHFNKEQFKDFF